MQSCSTTAQDTTNAASSLCADERPFRYVLSAGRTGTVFLEGFLNRQISKVTAVHEPPETRWQMMLANLRNDWGVGDGLLRAIFQRLRQKRESAVGGDYVELNPFLCAMTDLLPLPGRDLRVVHMVRDPATWAHSISSFKASSTFRPIIDLVPFAKPYPTPRPRNWSKLSDYERALWRWNWCNNRILELRDQCTAFTIVRYEDLFNADANKTVSALNGICNTLALSPPDQFDLDSLAKRLNPKPDKGLVADPLAASRICGELAREFGYAY
ncbi:hypothetical protein E1180_07615 [Roseibium denhamense]|uniref:Sulfotransferase n=1 Tax=Roseibium denhamense TaxID=76305 RepID=A0ABY1NWC0_9HYPH|nr:hypothetical protein [Roseibium denhamense]MTI05381.1 hypothetical protein [Roseibium denhamense]SMP17509.1 hypothetical protein SAMN06265374_1834 [Roseibium denhamense]